VKVQNSSYLSALHIQDQFLSQKSSTHKVSLPQGSASFQDILAEKTGRSEAGLKFSKHAVGRLADRNIRLTDDQMERLSDGTQKAGAKGIKESLVIVDQLAFIVNIPNQTVVTAMDQTEADTNIYTNIDGAVIM